MSKGSGISSHSGFDPSTGGKGGNCASGGGDFCGHNHQYSSGNVPDPNHSGNKYQYKYSQPVSVYGIEMEQHGNGINCINVKVDGVDFGTRCISPQGHKSERAITTITDYDTGQQHGTGGFWVHNSECASNDCGFSCGFGATAESQCTIFSYRAHYWMKLKSDATQALESVSNNCARDTNGEALEGFWHSKCNDKRRSAASSGALSELRADLGWDEIGIYFRPNRDSGVAAASTGVYKSCKELLKANPKARSGWYNLHIGGEAVYTKCNMDTDGGGWTLLAHEKAQVNYEKRYKFNDFSDSVVGYPGDESDIYYLPLRLWKQMSAASNLRNELLVEDNFCRKPHPTWLAPCVTDGKFLSGDIVALTGNGLSSLSLVECYESCRTSSLCVKWSWVAFKYGFYGYCSLHGANAVESSSERYVTGTSDCYPADFHTCVLQKYKITETSFSNSNSGLKARMTALECHAACARESQCKHWTWQTTGNCYLFQQSGQLGFTVNSGSFSGAKNCQPTPYASCVDNEFTFPSNALMDTTESVNERDCFTFCQLERSCAGWAWESSLHPSGTKCRRFKNFEEKVPVTVSGTISGKRDCHPRPTGCAPSIKNVRWISSDYNLACDESFNSPLLKEACDNNVGFTTFDKDNDKWENGNCAEPKSMMQNCNSVTASDWAGNFDWVSSGGTRYGCSPESNDNLLGYMSEKVTGDFEYSIVLDTVACESGVVFGFTDIADPSSISDTHPEANTPANNRWGVSTLCSNSQPGYIYADGSTNSNGNHDEFTWDIDVAVGDKVAISRSGNVFRVKVNDVAKYTFSRQSSGEGYIFQGHYNSGSAQCFSSPSLCKENDEGDGSPATFRTGFWYGDCSASAEYGKNNGGLATWSPTPRKNSPNGKVTTCTDSELKDWKNPDFNIDSNKKACFPIASSQQFTVQTRKRKLSGAFTVKVKLGNVKQFCEKRCDNVLSTDWNGGHDWVNSGGSRYGCTPENSNDAIAYLPEQLAGDFEYSMVLDSVVCGAGIVFGFSNKNIPSELVAPAANSPANKRWGFSTFCQEEYSCDDVAANEWAGNHDWISSGGSRYGCSPQSNGNLLAYIGEKITGDFEYSIVLDTAICGAGIVFGFTELNPSSISNSYPEANSPANNRWGFSTICQNGDPGYVYADGSSNSRGSHDESNTALVQVSVNDTVALVRVGSTFTFKINDVLKYTWAQKSNQDGYIFQGHYNSDSAQCFSSPKLCKTKNVAGYVYYDWRNIKGRGSHHEKS